jgi:hypothetical protein
VVLEIEPRGTGTLYFMPQPELRGCEGDAGTATGSSAADAGLGGGDAGAEAADSGALSGGACGTAAAGGAGGATPGLLLAHRYTLDGLSMSGASERDRRADPRVSFSLLIAEPWRDWCSNATLAADTALCSCNEEGCGVSAEALQVSLSLSRDGRALRGTLSSQGDVEWGAAGLELIRP